MIAETTVTVTGSPPMYLRALQGLAEAAGRYHARVSIGRAGQTADAKSIIQLLTLAATQGTELTIRAKGDDADAAVSALDGLIRSNFRDDLRPRPDKAG